MRLEDIMHKGPANIPYANLFAAPEKNTTTFTENKKGRKERMKDLPKVYVARPLMRRNKGGAEPTVVGYVASKAYLNSKTTRFYEGGKSENLFNVEYIGFTQEMAMLAKDYGFVIGRGKVENETQIFESYETCKEYTRTLNQNIAKQVIEGKTGKEAIIAANVFAGIMRLISLMETRNIGLADDEDQVDM